jgi:hypothetical protein
MLPWTLPSMYWPRTTLVWTSWAVIGRRQWSTPTLASRTTSAPSDQGGSMAVTHSTCRRWFCTMSRRAPMPS